MAPPQLRYDVERQLFDWFGQFYTAISGSDISEGGSGCVEHLLYRALPPKQCALWSAFFYKHNNNRERLSFDDVPITRFRFIDVPHCDHSAVKSAFEAFADNATPDNHVKLLATLPLQAPKVGVSQRNNGTFPRKQSAPPARDNNVDDSTDSSGLRDSDEEESSEDDHGFYGVDGQEDSSTTLGRTASQSGTVRWHRGALHLSSGPVVKPKALGSTSPGFPLPSSQSTTPPTLPQPGSRNPFAVAGSPAVSLPARPPCHIGPYDDDVLGARRRALQRQLDGDTWTALALRRVRSVPALNYFDLTARSEDSPLRHVWTCRCCGEPFIYPKGQTGNLVTHLYHCPSRLKPRAQDLLPWTKSNRVERKAWRKTPKRNVISRP